MKRDGSTEFARLADRTGWDNAEMARRLGVTTGAVRDWCDGRRAPAPGVVAYVKQVALAVETVGPPPPAPRVGRRVPSPAYAQG